MKLENIKKEEPLIFPLRSSLFWKSNMLDGYEGSHYASTWGFFCRAWNAKIRDEAIDKQTQYDSNMMTFYLYHYDDPNCVVNLFKGCPDPKTIASGNFEWDDTEVNKWAPYIVMGADPRIWLIPTLFCGDSKEATNNTKFHEVFLNALLPFLDPYIKAINIASEATKTMSVRQMENLISLCKSILPNKYVGAHIQCNEQGNFLRPGNADFIMLETSNRPKNGNDRSIASFTDEITKAIAKCPAPMMITETNIFCEDPRARAQSRAFSLLNGVYALPGPK